MPLQATPDASTTQVRYIKEVVPGTTPATPTLIEHRVTSVGLTPGRSDTESQELSRDPNIVDAPVTLEAPSGDLGFELSETEHDPFILAVMRAVKSTALSTGVSAETDISVVGNFFTASAGDVNVVNATKTYTSATAAFPTTIAASDIIVWAGFADADSNGTKTVVSADATNIVVTETVGANETPAGSVTVRNDTTKPTIVTAGAVDFTTISLSPEQTFSVSGFTGSPTANNQIFRALTVTATTITIKEKIVEKLSDDSSDNVLAMVTEAAGDAITFKGRGSTNSETRATFSQEVEYFIDDTTSVFDVYTGSEPTQMTLTLQAENILTGAFSFNSRGVSQDNTATIASSTTPSQTGDVANAISNLSEPVFDSVIYTDGVQSFDITLNNNPRNQTRVGTKSLAGIGLDKIIATIATSLYFSDANAVTQKANNNQSVEFYFRIDFASGGAMVWTFPNFKLNAAERPATGRATDVVLTVNGRGLKGKGANTAYTVRVDYIPA